MSLFCFLELTARPASVVIFDVVCQGCIWGLKTTLTLSCSDLRMGLTILSNLLAIVALHNSRKVNGYIFKGVSAGYTCKGRHNPLGRVVSTLNWVQFSKDSQNTSIVCTALGCPMTANDLRDGCKAMLIVDPNNHPLCAVLCWICCRVDTICQCSGHQRRSVAPSGIHPMRNTYALYTPLKTACNVRSWCLQCRTPSDLNPWQIVLAVQLHATAFEMNFKFQFLRPIWIPRQSGMPLNLVTTHLEKSTSGS